MPELEAAEENVKRDRISLLPGRRVAALTPSERKSIEGYFRALGYDGAIEFDDRNGGKTRFIVTTIDGEECTKIIVGADVYPGTDVLNPNAIMDPFPTVAHEISHHLRWESKRELPPGEFDKLEEALTSLDAACCFNTLTDLHIQQLISDAAQRIHGYIKDQEKKG